MESHTLMDGKVHVYRRENSRFWQCAVFLGGRNHRQTTRQKTRSRLWRSSRFAKLPPLGLRVTRHERRVSRTRTGAAGDQAM